MKEEYRHIPVMLNQVLDVLDLKENSIYLDCTLGGAGHASMAAQKIAHSGWLIGIDQDDAALKAARERLQKIEMAHEPILLKGNFGQLDTLLMEAGFAGVDAALFDLGVSSPQFDLAERGFSYRSDALLDMRMDTTSSQNTAADILQNYPEEKLCSIICKFGEEKYASKIAHLICKKRETQKIETTFQLVEIIKEAIPAAARRKGGHPAKRTFQALRIEINHELEMLKTGLEQAICWLNPGGVIAVISYHSLEDKMVKETFKKQENPCICPPGLPMCACGKKPVLKTLTRKGVRADKEELERNPRSHSAILRAAKKL